MKTIPLKRIMALIGVALILLLFILTIVFLVIGNSALAITFVAINGFITIILFFVLRFHQAVVDDNPEFIEANSDFIEGDSDVEHTSKVEQSTDDI